MLAPEEFARRLKAARELAGIKQRDLAQVTHDEDQLGVEDVGRLERPNDLHKPPPEVTLKHVQVYARRLGVPEAWFTEPDLPVVFGSGSSAESAVVLLQRQIDELRAELANHAGRLTRLGTSMEAEAQELPATTQQPLSSAQRESRDD